MPENITAWIEASLVEAPTAAFQARLRKELERRTAMTVTELREGFTTVTPYLTVADIDRLIEFTKEVFGAVETHRSRGSAGGTHCEVRIGDSMLMLGGGAMVAGREKVNALHVLVPDVDACFARAIAAGAQSLGEPADRPYGERSGFVKDPTGIVWYIATRPDRHPDFRAVTPYLHHRDAEGLMGFLKDGLGATEIGVFRAPDGRVMHAVFRLGDGALEFGEADPPGPTAFYLYVPDADALYARAVEAGAKSLYPPADQPYGDRVGGVEDAWGNTWYIASPLAGAS
jgi:PhnB protein